MIALPLPRGTPRAVTNTMGSGAWIAADFWTDNEFADSSQRLVALYIFAHRDPAGVVSWDINAIRGATKLSRRKITLAAEHFERIGKLRFSRCRLWGWWRGGIKYFLYKGNSSESQRQAVVRRLRAWEKAGVFGRGFDRMVIETYLDRYQIDIPYVYDEELTEDPNQLHLGLAREH